MCYALQPGVTTGVAQQGSANDTSTRQTQHLPWPQIKLLHFPGTDCDAAHSEKCRIRKKYTYLVVAVVVVCVNQAGGLCRLGCLLTGQFSFHDQRLNQTLLRLMSKDSLNDHVCPPRKVLTQSKVNPLYKKPAQSLPTTLLSPSPPLCQHSSCVCVIPL